MGVIRNLAKRIRLVDLVEDTKRYYQIIEEADNVDIVGRDKTKTYKYRCLVNNITRGAFRVVGYGAGIGGISLISDDPKNGLTLIGTGVGLHLIEFLYFDVLKPYIHEHYGGQ